MDNKSPRSYYTENEIVRIIIEAGKVKTGKDK